MKAISFFLVLIAISVSNCEDKKASDTEAEKQLVDTTAVTIEQQKKGISYNEVIITDLAKKELSQWTEFNNLNRELNNILEVDYRILKTELEVLNEAFVNIEESEFPEKLNLPRFKSKLTVLKTFTGKLGNEVETNESYEVLEATVKQISEELNAMKVQINELYTSDIDTDVLIIEPITDKEPENN